MAPATGRPPHTTDRGGYFAVVDPSTGEAFDEAPDRRPEELDPVVDRARAAWAFAHGMAHLELSQRFPAGADLEAAWAAGADALAGRDGRGL